MDITQEVFFAIKRIPRPRTVTTKIKEAGYPNAISPSRLKKVRATSNIDDMFNPQDLLKAGIISEEECEKRIEAQKRLISNAEFIINCDVGIIMHEMILPYIKMELEETYDAVVHMEFPIICKETGVIGTADLFVIDPHKKEIHLFDLKTTGPKILDMANGCEIQPQYQRQLYAYGKSLEYIFSDFKVASCNTIYVCKTARSNVYYPDELGTFKKTPLPLVVQSSSTLEETGKKFSKHLLELKELVVQYNKKILEADPSYKHWLLHEDEFDRIVEKRCKEEIK